MIVYTVNNNKRRRIGFSVNTKGTIKIITDYMLANQYIAPIIRTWDEDNETWYDAGKYVFVTPLRAD